MRDPKDGEYVGKRNDEISVCGDHSLKGAVKALEKEHENGSPHVAVRDMKGIKK